MRRHVYIHYLFSCPFTDAGLEKDEFEDRLERALKRVLENQRR